MRGHFGSLNLRYFTLKFLKFRLDKILFILHFSMRLFLIR
ncbi:hypothetical protein CAMRE0001_1039 [Campylobacter rectus RM3267]|uniref:Uncharacterized protein n=1 Tax=Campylobacter rectus RM3267 TaxID=553218 RepID=B9D2T8_CAMRE|nr:hypothetical protein CAMRE0001_1039 [Campylobacter rectus RM3267]